MSQRQSTAGTSQNDSLPSVTVTVLRSLSVSPNLGQSVPPVAGLLRGVLLFDNVSSRGHCAVKQSLLHVLFLGGQQLPHHRHQLSVLYQGRIAIHFKGQITLK